MQRFLLIVITLAGAGACNKPSADSCRQAIGNMQKILGTDVAAKNSDIEGEVRRCRGGSSQKAVACAIKASSRAELDACEFNAAKKK